MTVSPTFTSSGTRLPLSSMRPGPTATTVPSWGFSLAVSGMTRPEAVVEAVGVLDLDALQWLRTPPGVAAVALARQLLEDGVDLLHALDRLRPVVGLALAGPAWEVAKLREVARAKFVPDAAVMWYTVQTLEQAGRPELAARRAARLLRGGT